MDDSNNSEFEYKPMEAYPYRNHEAPFYSIPKIRDLYEPIMEFMNDVREANTYQIREAIANYFYLTEDETEYREHEKYTLFQMRVNVACNRLARRRLLENIGRGIYRISYLGDEALERKYNIDEDYLKLIPESEGNHADNVDLPIPSVRYEYVPIEEVTIKEIHEARLQDIRFNNMLMMKAVGLENGQIVNTVSRKVENKLCYQTNVETGDKKVKPRSVEGFHKGPSARKWSNPHPFINDPVRVANFKSGNSFGDTLSDLMDNHYNISKTQLSNKTGIPEKTIQRIRNSKTKNTDVRNVYAIAISLEIPPLIFRSMLQQLRWDPNPQFPPDSIYMTIYGVNRGMSIKKVNEACRKLGAPEIYPIDME